MGLMVARQSSVGVMIYELLSWFGLEQGETALVFVAVIGVGRKRGCSAQVLHGIILFTCVRKRNVRAFANGFRLAFCGGG